MEEGGRGALLVCSCYHRCGNARHVDLEWLEALEAEKPASMKHLLLRRPQKLL